MVGMTGFEPAASASRTQRSTKLSHIPKTLGILSLSPPFVNKNFSYRFYLLLIDRFDLDQIGISRLSIGDAPGNYDLLAAV